MGKYTEEQVDRTIAKFLNAHKNGGMNLMDETSTNALRRMRERYIGKSQSLSDDSEEQVVKKAAIPKELCEDWDVLDKANKLQQIKDSNFTLYSELYLEKFGKYPKDYSNAGVDYNVRKLYQDAMNEYKKKKYGEMDFDELLKKGIWLEKYKILDPAGYREKFTKKYGVAPKY